MSKQWYKNKRNIIIILAVAVALIFGFVYFSGNLKMPFAAGVTPTFTPIFCNDYEFTCCGGKVDSTTVYTVTDEIPFVCPSTALKCVILSRGTTGALVESHVGHTGCKMRSVFLLGDYWDCDDGVKSTQTQLNPGDNLYVLLFGVPTSNVQQTFQIKIYVKQLGFCGRSGSTGEEVTCGVPVSGSDQCTFHPNLNTIYTTTDSLIGKLTTTSYTVPVGNCVLAFQSGDRHICGYIEESCSVDGDCIGHTYGNKECYGRTLQTYGCRSFGTIISSKDRGPFDPSWSESDAPQTDTNTFGKRCEIISAQTVQCCGDTDCGSNMFCDVSIFSCKNKVQCTTDTQCGVSQQCDYTTKKLKTPKCSSGQCTYSEISVDCCNDQNCAQGYFCNVEKKCEQRINTCTTCPYECCVDQCTPSGGFFDRPCSSEKPYCDKGVCSSEPPKPSTCKTCDAYAQSTLLGWLFPSKKCDTKGWTFSWNFLPQNGSTCIINFLKLIAVPIIFLISLFVGADFFSKFKFTKKNKWIIWIASIIFAGLLGFLVYFAFWVGLILFILYLILSIILRKFGIKI